MCFRTPIQNVTNENCHAAWKWAFWTRTPNHAAFLPSCCFAAPSWVSAPIIALKMVRRLESQAIIWLQGREETKPLNNKENMGDLEHIIWPTSLYGTLGSSWAIDQCYLLPLSQHPFVVLFYWNGEKVWQKRKHWKCCTGKLQLSSDLCWESCSNCVWLTNEKLCPLSCILDVIKMWWMPYFACCKMGGKNKTLEKIVTKLKYPDPDNVAMLRIFLIMLTEIFPYQQRLGKSSKWSKLGYLLFWVGHLKQCTPELQNLDPERG